MPGLIDSLGLIIFIGMLRLRSYLPLVLLIILVDSFPSLVQTLFGQTKRTFIYAEVVIVINRVVFRR